MLGDHLLIPQRLIGSPAKIWILGRAWITIRPPMNKLRGDQFSEPDARCFLLPASFIRRRISNQKDEREQINQNADDDYRPSDEHE
jgi:hypothetical protein